jgi:hypothetical protein
MSDYTISCDALYEVGDRVHETAAGSRGFGLPAKRPPRSSVDIERHAPSDVFPPALKLLLATREVMLRGAREYRLARLFRYIRRFLGRFLRPDADRSASSRLRTVSNLWLVARLRTETSCGIELKRVWKDLIRSRRTHQVPALMQPFSLRLALSKHEMDS